MKKGIVVIHAPIGNLRDKKLVNRYIKKSILFPMRKAVKQIKESGYIVLVFPSRERTDFLLEVTNFGR
jgi:hypothetical protein